MEKGCNYVSTGRKVGMSTLPSQTAPANGGQPRSVLWLQHGQHVAPPKRWPLGRSCLRLCFAPALLDQGKAPSWHLGGSAEQEQILEVSMNVCQAPALHPGVGLTQPGHPSTMAQLCPTCVTAARVLPAPINEAAF